MEYLFLFLEGIVTFISPCLLPMLPIYVSYFAGGKEERHTKKTLINSLGFVLGFTIVFVALGALAGTIGYFLVKYRTLVNIVTGLVVVFFGLNFLGIFKLNIFKGMKNNVNTNNMGFFSSLLLGIVFAVGWTPCVGAFLGTALMIVAHEGEVIKGIVMLLIYSVGLGIPFLVSALLIDKLKEAFKFIKRHYNVINIISGSILVVVGILMMTGIFQKLINNFG